MTLGLGRKLIGALFIMNLAQRPAAKFSSQAFLSRPRGSFVRAPGAEDFGSVGRLQLNVARKPIEHAFVQSYFLHDQRLEIVSNIRDASNEEEKKADED